MLDFFRYLIDEAPELLERTGEHLMMSALAVAIALAVGVPLGILITRRERTANWVLGLCNTVQAIPTLAFVGFMIPLTGLGAKTAVVTLFAYSLLPIVHNTYTGLKQVDAGMIEAARGMGMTPRQILRMVRLPLALSVMVVGIRLATVMALGNASIMSLAGAGGLGQMIFTGINRVNDTMVLAGALPAAVLAVLADWGLGRLERRLTPRGIRTDSDKNLQAAVTVEKQNPAVVN